MTGRVDVPLHGKAYVFGDNVPGDDGVIPFKVVGNIYESAEMDFGSMAMTPIDPTFPARFQRGGFIVAGKNFPTGPAHEQGVWALVEIGVAAIIAETVSANFFRAAVNDGLPVFSLPGITSVVREGDDLEVHLRKGLVRNLTTGAQLQASQMPDGLASILNAGGRRAHAAIRYRERSVRGSTNPSPAVEGSS